MKHFTTDNPFQLRINTVKGVEGKPLSGKTLGVKDMFDISGFPTTAGNPTWYMTHSIPESTSPAVQQLLDNGCQLVGKTVTDELAYSLNGQNIHYGTPLNAKYPLQIPGGSSSGSAIAVANGWIDVGLGTDTGGSIRVPASYNGLFGFRPTHGVISTDNMVALAPSFDTVGWLTRDFSTLEMVADVLLERQPVDIGVRNYKINIAGDLMSGAEHSDQLVSYIKKLQHLDYVKVDTTFSPLKLAELENSAEAFRVLQAYEIWQTHGQWITKHQPNFAEDINNRFVASSRISVADYQQALKHQQGFNHSIDMIFESCDFIALPTTPGRAPLLSASADELARYRSALMSMTCIAGLGGLPQLHIPLGLFNGRPTGLSLIGKKNTDRLLFDVAKQFQESLV